MFFNSITVGSTRMRGITPLVLVIYLWWWSLTIEAHPAGSQYNAIDIEAYDKCMKSRTRDGIVHAIPLEIENCVQDSTGNLNFKVPSDFKTHRFDVSLNSLGEITIDSHDDTYTAAQFLGMVRTLRQPPFDTYSYFMAMAADVLEEKAKSLKASARTSNPISPRSLQSDEDVPPATLFQRRRRGRGGPLILNSPPEPTPSNVTIDREVHTPSTPKSEPSNLDSATVYADGGHIYVNNRKTTLLHDDGLINVEHTPHALYINGEQFFNDMFLEPSPAVSSPPTPSAIADHETSTPSTPSTPKGDDITRQRHIQNGFDVLDLNGQITINNRPTNIKHAVPLKVTFEDNPDYDCVVNHVPVTRDIFVPSSIPFDSSTRIGSRGGRVTVNGVKTIFLEGSSASHRRQGLRIQGKLFTDAMFTD